MKYHLTLLLTTFLMAPVTAREPERFDTQEIVTVTRPQPRSTPSPTPAATPAMTRLTLRVGEIRPVLESRGSIFSPGRDAFYLPPEALGIVQLIIERKGGTTTYFLKGLKKGVTAGGVVRRSWLDREGFQPRSITDQGRIQQALRQKPWYITVQ